jgi:predicted amidohydrolase YtcJ
VLTPGARADVAVRADDLVACVPSDVLDVPVVLTVAGGRIVHRADAVS